jgi:two-component system LytT family response regulator
MSARSIRALVADDEPLARDRIRRLLDEEPDVDIVAECADGDAAVAAIRAHRPDLAFLDVQMPGLDGLSVLDAVRPAELPVVVFVTAFDQYAIRAFEVNALDYLVKPFNTRRFRAAVARARQALREDRGSHEGRLLALVEQLSAEKRELERRLGAPGDAKPPEQGAHPDRLTIRTQGRIFFVRTTDIDWIGTAGNYVELHVGPAKHLLRESLASLAARLDPARFVRIHRTTMVNVDRIREVQPWFSGDYVVILQSGAKLNMSRTYRASLLAGE